MTPELWKKVCAALDFLESLPQDQRTTELNRLRSSDPAVAVEVESLLAEQDTNNTLDLDSVASVVKRKAGQLEASTGAFTTRDDPDSTLPSIPGCTLKDGRGNIKFGGMGVVYFGTDFPLRRPVAVKVLRQRLAHSPEMIARFEAEAQVCAQLQHPGIVPVYQVGELDDGRPFYTMKRVRGQTLADLLKKRASPSTDLLLFLSYFRQVCEAMAYAHAHNVLHRDLKPANVMVGDYGEVLLMDWGLAKVLGDSGRAESTPEPASAAVAVDLGVGDRSPTKGALGTLAYMPPEQATGKVDEVDKRSDVFGLGAILCTILTGQPPYIGANEDMVERKAIRGDLSEVLERLGRCGADVELVELAKHCLSLKRDNRPADGGATAGQVVDYIKSMEDRRRHSELEQKAAEVRSEERLRQAELERNAAEMLARHERKRRRLVAVLALLGLAMLLIVAVAWGWIDRTQEASRRQLTVQIELELARAESLAEQARKITLADSEKRRVSARLWDECIATAEKAERIQYSASLGVNTREMVEKGVTSLRAEAAGFAQNSAMVERLEHVKEMRRLVTDDDFEWAHPNSVLILAHDSSLEYAKVFAENGIDVFQLSPEQVASQIQQQFRICTHLIDALDDWLAVEIGHPSAVRLLQASQAVDPDPFRNRIRQAVAKLEHDTLQQIAAQKEAANLSQSMTLLLAQGLGMVGEFHQAADILRAAQRRLPDSFWINTWLGGFLLNSDLSRADEAARCLSVALALRPDSYTTQVDLGKSLKHLGKWREAKEVLAAARNGWPLFSLATTEYCDLLSDMGQGDEAIRICKELHHNSPRNVMALAQLSKLFKEKKDLAQSLVYAQMLTAQAPNWPYSHVVLGNVWAVNGKLGEAVSEYNHSLQLHPYCVQAHLGLVVVYAMQRKPEDAMKSVETVKRYSPDHPELYVAIAALCSLQNNPKGALKASRRAVALQPSSSLSRVTHGIVCSQNNANEEAIASFEEAITLQPHFASAHCALGHAYLKKKENKKAISSFEQALELDKKCEMAHVGLGEAFAHDGQSFEKATFHLGEALKLNSRSIWAYKALGKVHVAKGDYDAAITPLESAIKVGADPAYAFPGLQNMMPYDVLGTVYFRKGKFDLAETSFMKAIEQNSVNLDAQFGLGHVLAATGNNDKAIQHLKTAFELDPANQAAAIRLLDAFIETGRLSEAREFFQRIAQKTPKSANRFSLAGRALYDVNKLLPIENKIEDILNGHAKPRDFDEYLDFGKVCQGKRHYVAALRLFEEGYAIAKKTMNLDSDTCFALAKVAFLAVEGKGKDQLSEIELSTYRGKALTWLKRSLALEKNNLKQNHRGYRYLFQQRVRTLLQHQNLAVVHPRSLDKLPDEERNEWERFWAEVEEWLAKADKPVPE